MSPKLLKQKNLQIYKSTLFKKFFYSLLIFLLYFFSIGRDYYETNYFGGSDLRNRIVGARLLKAQKDPYFYMWHEKDFERFLDIRQGKNNIVNRVTIPPSLLLILESISNYNYPKIRIGYLYIMYLIYFIILLIFINLSKYTYSKISIAILGAIFISVIPVWFLHIERGHIYLTYIFLLSLSYFCIKKKYKILSAMFLSLDIWIRPNLLLFIYPLLINNIKEFRIKNFIKRNTKNSFLLSLIILTTMLFSWSFYLQNGTWHSYLKSTEMWSKYQISGIAAKGNNKVIEYPLIIEGRTINYYKTMNKDIDEENFSMQNLAKRFFNLSLKNYELIILYILVLAVITYFLNNNHISDESLFLYGFLIYTVNEYFIPVPRYSYNSVQIIFPALVMISSPVKNKMIYLMIFIAFLLMSPLLTMFPFNMSVGEIIMLIISMFYIKEKKKDLAIRAV